VQRHLMLGEMRSSGVFLSRVDLRGQNNIDYTRMIRNMLYYMGLIQSNIKVHNNSM
jgi:hypothetical protein